MVEEYRALEKVCKKILGRSKVTAIEDNFLAGTLREITLTLQDSQTKNQFTIKVSPSTLSRSRRSEFLVQDHPECPRMSWELQASGGTVVSRNSVAWFLEQNEVKDPRHLSKGTVATIPCSELSMDGLREQCRKEKLEISRKRRRDLWEQDCCPKGDRDASVEVDLARFPLSVNKKTRDTALAQRWL